MVDFIPPPHPRIDFFIPPPHPKMDYLIPPPHPTKMDYLIPPPDPRIDFFIPPPHPISEFFIPPPHPRRMHKFPPPETLPPPADIFPPPPPADICMVLDLDGFISEKKFLVREMGYCSVTRLGKNESIRFNLQKHFEKMSKKDLKTNMYVKTNIHGLSLRPAYKEECLEENCMEDVLRNIYEKNKTSQKYIVGYKGGIYEKKLLDKLNIPSINLENFGCPKVEKLIEELNIFGLLNVVSCGFHSPLIKTSKIPHCAKFETFCFVKWLLEKQNLNK